MLCFACFLSNEPQRDKFSYSCYREILLRYLPISSRFIAFSLVFLFYLFVFLFVNIFKPGEPGPRGQRGARGQPVSIEKPLVQ